MRGMPPGAGQPPGMMGPRGMPGQPGMQAQQFQMRVSTFWNVCHIKINLILTLLTLDKGQTFFVRFYMYVSFNCRE